jgi:hypothetical protein
MGGIAIVGAQRLFAVSVAQDSARSVAYYECLVVAGVQYQLLRKAILCKDHRITQAAGKVSHCAQP